MEKHTRKFFLKDLAKHLGVSASTVSMALKDHPEISASTIEKVKKLAAAWHFNLNPLSSFLPNQHTYTLGVLIPDVSTPVYPSMISGIEEVAKANGFNVVIITSQDLYKKEKESLHKLLLLKVDGLLISLAQETTDFGHFDPVIDANLPLVFFDRTCRSSEVSSVAIDLAAAVRDLCLDLCEKGATRIAFVGDALQYRNTDKIRGYRKGLQACGFSFEEQLLVNTCSGEDETALTIRELLFMAKRPDAIICANDAVLFAVLNEIKKIGLKMPSDIRLGAFIDPFQASLLTAPLTAIVCPYVEVGQEAARLLIKEIKEDKKEVMHICMPAKLMLHASLSHTLQ